MDGSCIPWTKVAAWTVNGSKGGLVSKETVVLRRWESKAGNLVLTAELKT